MSEKKSLIWIVSGLTIAYTSLWVGSWLLHIVPQYLGVAAFGTMFSGLIIGIAVGSNGLINYKGEK